jgi:hypothetical protein
MDLWIAWQASTERMNRTMGNNLNMEKQQQILVFTNSEWTEQAISRGTGINRETIGKYRKTFQNRPEVPTDTQSNPSRCRGTIRGIGILIYFHSF